MDFSGLPFEADLLRISNITMVEPDMVSEELLSFESHAQNSKGSVFKWAVTIAAISGLLRERERERERERKRERKREREIK